MQMSSKGCRRSKHQRVSLLPVCYPPRPCGWAHAPAIPGHGEGEFVCRDKEGGVAPFPNEGDPTAARFPRVCETHHNTFQPFPTPIAPESLVKGDFILRGPLAIGSREWHQRGSTPITEREEELMTCEGKERVAE